MKKRTTMLALLLATGAGTCLQAQEKLTQFKVRDAITVRTPIMNDSINPKGEKYADRTRPCRCSFPGAEHRYCRSSLIP